ncbi:MAG: elements of external origin [Alphaproteobacteria bacterium]|nr:elements of external origin [Alphaproteobacteria bacterium]
MGISIRAYARHRGISDAAVRKAIKTGRVTPEPDGTIDTAKADRQWQTNTNQQPASYNLKAVPDMALDAVRETLKENSMAVTGNGTTFIQARTANEVLKAQTNRIRLQKLKGELIDRAKVLAHVYKLARTERDAWINWPARISSTMAAELSVDAHTMHVTLERYVREQLSELAEFKIRID